MIDVTKLKVTKEDLFKKHPLDQAAEKIRHGLEY